MKIISVISGKTKRKFLGVASTIYHNDKVWVRPFDKEIEAIFDPQKNPFLNTEN